MSEALTYVLFNIFASRIDKRLHFMNAVERSLYKPKHFFTKEWLVMACPPRASPCSKVDRFLLYSKHCMAPCERSGLDRAPFLMGESSMKRERN